MGLLILVDKKFRSAAQPIELANADRSGSGLEYQIDYGLFI
jgi:hypothetical protein